MNQKKKSLYMAVNVVIKSIPCMITKNVKNMANNNIIDNNDNKKK